MKNYTNVPGHFLSINSSRKLGLDYLDMFYDFPWTHLLKKRWNFTSLKEKGQKADQNIYSRQDWRKI